MVKDKHRKQSLKPVSRDSQVSRTSRRSISRVEEPINTSGQPSRQESAQREGTEPEETPIHIEEEQEEAVEEHVEIVSRDTTPPRRESMYSILYPSSDIYSHIVSREKEGCRYRRTSPRTHKGEKTRA